MQGCDGVHENSHLSNANSVVQIRTNANANANIEKKLKYDMINTDNMMQSTNITSNDCHCECKIEI